MSGSFVFTDDSFRHGATLKLSAYLDNGGVQIVLVPVPHKRVVRSNRKRPTSIVPPEEIALGTRIEPRDLFCALAGLLPSYSLTWREPAQKTGKEA